eukprot:g33885.t1
MGCLNSWRSCRCLGNRFSNFNNPIVGLSIQARSGRAHRDSGSATRLAIQTRNARAHRANGLTIRLAETSNCSDPRSSTLKIQRTAPTMTGPAHMLNGSEFRRTAQIRNFTICTANGSIINHIAHSKIKDSGWTAWCIIQTKNTSVNKANGFAINGTIQASTGPAQRTNKLAQSHIIPLESSTRPSSGPPLMLNKTVRRRVRKKPKTSSRKTSSSPKINKAGSPMLPWIGKSDCLKLTPSRLTAKHPRSIPRPLSWARSGTVGASASISVPQGSEPARAQIARTSNEAAKPKHKPNYQRGHTSAGDRATT